MPEEKMMPQYQSHKKVWALEIKSVIVEHNGTSILSFEDDGYSDIKAPLEMFARYKPLAGDFYVIYEDGYKSFSPRKAFLDGYTKIEKVNSNA